MRNKMKSLAPVATLAFVVLFFGPSTSKARAQHFGPDVSFHGHVRLPHGSINVNVGNRGFYRHQSFNRSYSPYYRHVRPYYGSSFYGYPQPYRLVRVFLYTPFPHWGFRRVYSSAPAYGASCSPY